MNQIGTFIFNLSMEKKKKKSPGLSLLYASFEIVLSAIIYGKESCVVVKQDEPLEKKNC